MIRKVVIAVTVFLIIFLCVLYIFGSRSIAALSKNILENQTVLKGSVSAERIEADWNGKVSLTNLVWNDENGAVVASVPSAKLSLNFFSAIFEGGTEGVITAVELQQPEFFYNASPNSNLLAVQDIFADKINSGGRSFTGTISADDGVVQITDGGKKYLLHDVTAEVSVQDNAMQSGDFSAVYQNAELSLTADKHGDSINYRAKGRNLPAQDIAQMVQCSKNTRIEAGTVNIELNSDDNKMTVNGNINGVAGTCFDLPVTELNGAFHGNADALTITQMNMLLAGQPMNIFGSIKLPGAARSKAEYDLQFNSGAFALNAISAGINVTDGVTVQGKITGSLLNPVLEGNFGIKSLDFPPLKIDEFHGSFLYFGDKLNIANAIGQVGSGAVKADGELSLKSGEFKFNLLAEKIPAEPLTDAQLSGNITFDATVIGSNETESANALGDFAITEGQYKGIDFSKITGVVYYNKSGYKFSDVYLHTFLGRLPMDAVLLDNGKLRFTD